MRIIEQKVDCWGECPTDRQKSIEHIEKAGRVCWASEPKGDPEDFVEKIWARGHGSVLEHSNVVIRTRTKSRYPLGILNSARLKWNSPYFHFMMADGYVYVAGNWRAFLEFLQVEFESFPQCMDNDDWEVLRDHKDIPYELKRVTVDIVTDRAVLAEITRHRNDTAFSVRSQRYCNESDLHIVRPSWFGAGDNESVQHKEACDEFCKAMIYAEACYRSLQNSGLSRQHSRVVLPNQTATRIIMSAYMPQWESIIALRSASSVYPQMRAMINEVQSHVLGTSEKEA